MTHYFPMFIDLREQPVLVIGGGRIATRRAVTLAAFGAKIRVVAQRIDKRLTEVAAEVMIRQIREGDLESLITAEHRLVLASTDDSDLNGAIGRFCRKKGIPVNVCDSPKDCDFFFPAVAMNEEIAVGITSSGQDHHQVAEIAKRIRAVLDDREG
ncbi:MAG: bifunctional precorrin-2 dehydrogenase/sirohydrochlorin ferrochelatase [Eubacteriales bacterium]|nr:bifunctional precorrin-2 dehydrogenase/sirohydrochlorin ferrochelatase [Eubacteriales bacterium]